MDILYYFIGLIAVFVGAGVGGFVSVVLIQGYGYNNLNNKLARVENKLASGLGVSAKLEDTEELNVVMLEAATILKDDLILKEDKPKQLIGLALKHPRVAMQLVKKFGLKGLI